MNANRSSPFRSTTDWGPSFWFFLHTSSLAYPVTPSSPHVKAAIDFLILLPNLLPCPYCQQHARDYVSKANLVQATMSRQSLFEFYVHFHNAVNQRLRKPLVGLMQARNMYSTRVTGWGPPFWFFLHMTALTYRDQPTFTDQTRMRQFLETFHIWLPTTAAQHLAYTYTSEMGGEALTWACLNKANLFYFWFTFHNHVNRRLGKEELTLQRVKELYKTN